MSPKLGQFLNSLCFGLLVFESVAFAIFVFGVVVSRLGTGKWFLPLPMIAAVVLGFVTNIVVFLIGLCVSEMHMQTCRSVTPD